MLIKIFLRCSSKCFTMFIEMFYNVYRNVFKMLIKCIPRHCKTLGRQWVCKIKLCLCRNCITLLECCIHRYAYIYICVYIYIVQIIYIKSFNTAKYFCPTAIKKSLFYLALIYLHYFLYK